MKKNLDFPVLTCIIMYNKVFTVVATFFWIKVNSELCGFIYSKSPNGGFDRKWSVIQRRNIPYYRQVYLIKLYMKQTVARSEIDSRWVLQELYKFLLFSEWDKGFIQTEAQTSPVSPPQPQHSSLFYFHLLLHSSPQRYRPGCKFFPYLFATIILFVSV